MKQFLLRILLFGGILVSILLVLTSVSGNRTKQYTYSYVNKMNRLDSIESPRIIFVGGSNVAFGVNCEKISDSLNVKAHNSAVHAGIGLKFMLEDLEPHLREGDEIVIMPEYTQFGSTFYGSGESLTDVVVFTLPDAFRILSLEQWITVLSNLPKHINNKLMFRIRPGVFNYTSLGFNEFGDEISHYNYPRADFDVVEFNDEISESNIGLFHDTIERYKQKGCKVYIFPPAIAQSVYERNKEYIRLLEERLSQYGIEFEVPSNQHVFPDSMTFDTYYHMGKHAVDSLSKLIIKEYTQIIK